MDEILLSNRQGPVATVAGVAAVPEEALASLNEQIALAGDSGLPPAAYAGSVGRTMFDTATAEDGTVTVLIPSENLESVPAQSLVRIKSVRDGRSYLGAVVQGPFAEPDGLKADAPVLVSATVRGGLLMPRFHGRVQVSLIGEEAEDGSLCRLGGARSPTARYLFWTTLRQVAS